MKVRKIEQASERLGELLREAHHRIEATKSTRISQADMAAKLGVSQRAYVNYLRGKGPTGARVAFEILSMLDEVEAIRLLRRWREWSVLTDANSRKSPDEN